MHQNSRTCCAYFSKHTWDWTPASSWTMSVSSSSRWIWWCLHGKEVCQHFCQPLISVSPWIFSQKCINMKTILGCWMSCWFCMHLVCRRLTHLKIQTCTWSGRRWWNWIVTRTDLFGTFWGTFPLQPPFWLEALEHLTSSSATTSLRHSYVDHPNLPIPNATHIRPRCWKHVLSVVCGPLIFEKVFQSRTRFRAARSLGCDLAPRMSLPSRFKAAVFSNVTTKSRVNWSGNSANNISWVALGPFNVESFPFNQAWVVAREPRPSKLPMTAGNIFLSTLFRLDCSMFGFISRTQVSTFSLINLSMLVLFSLIWCTKSSNFSTRSMVPSTLDSILSKRYSIATLIFPYWHRGFQHWHSICWSGPSMGQVVVSKGWQSHPWSPIPFLGAKMVHVGDKLGPIHVYHLSTCLCPRGVWRINVIPCTCFLCCFCNLPHGFARLGVEEDDIKRVSLSLLLGPSMTIHCFAASPILSSTQTWGPNLLGKSNPVRATQSVRRKLSTKFSNVYQLCCPQCRPSLLHHQFVGENHPWNQNKPVDIWCTPISWVPVDIVDKCNYVLHKLFQDSGSRKKWFPMPQIQQPLQPASPLDRAVAACLMPRPLQPTYRGHVSQIYSNHLVERSVSKQPAWSAMLGINMNFYDDMLTRNWVNLPTPRNGLFHFFTRLFAATVNMEATCAVKFTGELIKN